jgi:hypothetical protein
MILATHGIIQSGTAVIVTPLLDIYPSAAAAYSLRLLRTAYTGSAIRVRRASDNTEQNIGFTALGGLDTSALTTFCSGTNGFVTTLYDQSGNSGRNATQTTAANQPQIVSNGSVILTNGKPSLLYDGTDQLSISNFITSFNNLSSFFVHKLNSLSPNSISLTLVDGVQAIYIPWIRTGNDDFYYGNGFIYSGSPSTTNRRLITLYSDTTTGYLKLNGSSVANRANGTTTGGTHQIGGYAGNDLRPNMNFQELVIYSGTNQTSNISGIESNINSFYSIY